MKIDINCDLGESFGVYRLGEDEQLIPLVTSANIACGYHAGDPATMRRTVRLCLEHKVAIGAHPGLPDLQGFGRRPMQLTPQEAYDLVLYQIGALSGFVRAEGGVLSHVKPHGALYNMAVVSAGLAEAIAEAVYRFDPHCVLYGLAGSELVMAGERIGLRTANEVFADRAYQNDGTLVPRNQAGAVLEADKAVEQAVHIVTRQSVMTVQGHGIPLQADTICVHGDGQESALLLKKLRARFRKERIQWKSLERR